MEDSNIDLITGKISFSISLLGISGVSPGYNFSLNYNNANLRTIMGKWNREVNSGFASCWSINSTNKIIRTGDMLDYRYTFCSGDNVTELEFLHTEDERDFYQSRYFSNNQFFYDKKNKNWTIINENGLKHVFGNSGSVGIEKGDYDPSKGTYSQATKEYLDIRKLISNPDEATDIPYDALADNTICGSSRSNVVWGPGNTIAPTWNVEGQKSDTFCWDLNYIEDAFGNKTVFYYIQHLENATPGAESLAFTVCSYLYKVESQTVQGEVSEKLVLNYNLKDTNEYDFIWGRSKRPNGYQQGFEKLFFNRITKIVAETPKDSISLVTDIHDTTIGPTLEKRVLKEVKFETYSLSSHDYVEVKPSYQFDYYGNRDGVSVGTSGFDDMRGAYLFNETTHALYGSLKSILYPSGLKKVYRYAENELSSVDTQAIIFNDIKIDKNKSELINTYFDYTICLLNKKSGEIEFSCMTWGLGGWTHQVLGTYASGKSFDKDIHIVYRQRMIAYFQPDLKKWYLWIRKIEDMEHWIPAEFSGGSDITPNVKTVSLYFSEKAFVVTNNGLPLIYKTIDYGETWEKVSSEKLFSSEHYVQAYAKGNYVYIFYTSLKEREPLRKGEYAWTDFELNYSLYDMDAGVYKIKNKFLAPSYKLFIYNENYSSALEFFRIEKLLPLQCNGDKLLFAYKAGGRYTVDIQDSQSHVHHQAERSSGNWGIPLVLDQQDGTLKKLKTDEFFHYGFSSNLSFFPDCKIGSAVSNALISDNAFSFVYTIDSAYNPLIHKKKLRLTLGTNFTADGDSYKEQKFKFGTDYVQLLYLDETFMVVYQGNAKSQSPTYSKQYYYYDVDDSEWKHIVTSGVDTPSVRCNDSEKTALEVLSIVGLVLGILLMPFGLGSTIGIVITVAMTALTIATMTLSSVYKNSFTSSMAMSSFTYTNRFFNDGKCIWFREDSQDKVTAIGAGESGKGYDCFSDAKIEGNVLGTKQLFGSSYNFIPFVTDKNFIYYRNLTNGDVGSYTTLGPFTEGINDAYEYEGHVYYVKGSSQFKRFAYSDSIYNLTKGVANSVDAVCVLTAIPKSLESLTLFFDGENIFHRLVGGPFSYMSVPTKITDSIEGSRFRKVDAAVESAKKNFYMFSDGNFEYVEYTPEKFFVARRGKILDLLDFDTGITPFDKIEAAWWESGKLKLLRSQQLATIANLNSKITKVEAFYDAYNDSSFYNKDESIYYTSETVSFYTTTDTPDIYFYKYINGKLNGVIKDHVVRSVEFYYGKDRGDSPTSVTQYHQNLENATYIAGVGGMYKDTTVILPEEKPSCQKS